MSSFKAQFVVGILRFQQWFDVDLLGFQIEHFGLFAIETLGYFLKNWGIFSYHLVTLPH
jgi:hypothetical protein